MTTAAAGVVRSLVTTKKIFLLHDKVEKSKHEIGNFKKLGHSRHLFSLFSTYPNSLFNTVDSNLNCQ